MLERVKIIYRAMSRGITPQRIDDMMQYPGHNKKTIGEFISLHLKYYYKEPEELVDMIQRYDARRSKANIFLSIGSKGVSAKGSAR